MSRPQSPTIGPGSRVRLHFRLQLEDGTVVDDTFGGEPLSVTLGDGTLARGLEMALLGMKSGDRETVRVGPEMSGFGERSDEAVQRMPRGDFPPDMALETGMIVAFTTPGGDEVPGAVRKVDEASVTVDLNHPLAGHELTFQVEILAVEPPAPDGAA